MGKHDKADRRNAPGNGQSKRLGTSILVAATSLLGTSLGVSAATPAEPLGAQDSSGRHAVETTAVEQKNLLAGNVTNVPAQPPHMAIKPPSQVHIKSNQDKDFSTNQLKSNYIKSNYIKSNYIKSNYIKSNHSKDKDFLIANQLKSNYIKSNHSKDNDFPITNQLKNNHLKSNQFKE